MCGAHRTSKPARNDAGAIQMVKKKKVGKTESCSYCGSTQQIEDDHVIAESKGGERTERVCRACNGSKGDKPLIEWLRWVKKNDSRRWGRIEKHNHGKRNDIAKKVHIIRDED